MTTDRTARRTHPWHLAALAVALHASAARADDTWTTPFPGIRYLRRTQSPRISMYAAVVDLCAPGVSVQQSSFEERGGRTSTWAAGAGVQWAINGDFSCRPVDVVAATSPLVQCVGHPAYMTYGVAAHAGVPWPDPPFHDAVMAFAPGRAEVFQWDLHQAFEPWMREVISGHWSMLIDGVATDACASDTGRPSRTAIGMNHDRTQLILATADGDRAHGVYNGRTCPEMGEFLRELGATDGFNLDGGGSTTMWSAAAGVLNHPEDGSERIVGPHFGIHATGVGPALHCVRGWRVDAAAALPAVSPAGPRGRLTALPRARLLDTHDATVALDGLMRDPMGRVAGDSAFTSGSLGAAGVPPGATAAVVTLSLLDAPASGFASAFAADLPRPVASTLNYPGAVALGNLAMPGVDGRARFSVYVSSAAQVTADLDGYFAPTGAGFVPETPRRLLDTRTADAPLVPGVERVIVTGIAAGTTALALDVVTAAATAPGSVKIYRCGEANTSGETVSARIEGARSRFQVARVGPSGLCAVSDTPVHLIVDAMGHFDATGGLDYQPLAPTRLVDTRQTTGAWTGRIPHDTSAEIVLSRAPGFPSDAQAVALNVTTVNPAEGGFVSLYPCDAARATSSVNYVLGETVANAVIVGLAAGTRLCAYALGSTDLVVDVVGVFVPPRAAMSDAAVGPYPDVTIDVAVLDVGVRDAGVGSAMDASVRDAAASASVTGDTGCGCTAGTGGSARALAWAALGLTALGGRRRRTVA